MLTLDPQGCCTSSPTGDDSPYPDSTTPTSSHAINQPPPTPTPADPNPIQAPRRRRRAQQPLDQHINKPLRRHVWTSKRRWTRAGLDAERAAFFDTRVTGRQEVWGALHAALQVLWDPVGAGGEDGAGGLATAQSIIDAAEITLPTGDLARGAYDGLGNYYAFHEWVVSDPENLVEEGDEGSEVSEVGELEREDVKGTGVEEREVEGEEAVRRREEKGKGVVDVRDLITVYARLSENARDIKVCVAKSESVRSVARKVLEESGVSLGSPIVSYPSSPPFRLTPPHTLSTVVLTHTAPRQ